MAKSKKKIKNIWGTLSVKLSAIISSVLTVILVAAICVVSCNDFLYGTISLVFGGERRIVKEGKDLYANYIRYKTEYESKKDVLAAAEELNKQIVSEGITLLKNDDILPFDSNTKVSVFGKNSVNLVLGGDGSSAGSRGGAADGLYKSLEAVDLQYNDTLRKYYLEKADGERAKGLSMGDILTGLPTGEATINADNGYADSKVSASIEEYNGAALVVISRIGGEGYDMPRTMFWNKSKGQYTDWNASDVIPGARSKEDHYLELDQNEENMIRYASKKFNGNVILIINSSTPLELDFLRSDVYGKVKGALWIGHTGGHGIDVLGKVLVGDIVPSGRTVDTYPVDFTKDPTWNNFGNNMKGNGNLYKNSDNIRYVEYEEGIYVGYRYYETRGYEEEKAGNENWYNSNVVYPFGYGLSYATFRQEIVSEGTTPAGELESDGTITIKVKVTNTGVGKTAYAGKEVVQLYYTAPYETGKIEKAHVVLGAFAKTPVLYPASQADEKKGKPNSCTLELKINVRDMASYDYNDANKNEFTGYELDGGNYEIKLMKNAHETIDSITYTVPESGYTYRTNDIGNEVNNLFDDVSFGTSLDGSVKIADVKYMSRKDFEGTWPTMVTEAQSTLTPEQSAAFTFSVKDEDAPWYATEKPMQRSEAYERGKAPIQLYDMLYQDDDGNWHVKDYNDNEAWDALLDQLTVAEMKKLVISSAYCAPSIESIGKPLGSDGDGPVGHAAFMGDPGKYQVCYYASECVMAATWNVELAESFGEMIGDEALVGDARNGLSIPYTGWYAPAVNIHRSQFSGRNYEYYSEDGLLSGKMAANVIRGAKSKGVITYMKHFALNDQETNRDVTGVSTWANEQSMREIYLKAFELGVKEGKSNGIMTSFNRIGTTWAGGSYNLLTKLLREEWGFVGVVVTDFNLDNYMDVGQMLRAGGDTSLSASKPLKTSSATTQVQLRRALKNVLYTYANSNIMNGWGEGVVFGYTIPLWFELLIWASVAVFVIGAGLTTTFVLLAKKRLKAQNVSENTDEVNSEITEENSVN